MNKQTLQVNGAVVLALRVYEPAGAARASVVIGGAMGVRQSFYEAFARWMAQQGFRVTTFDYRGHGDSLHGAMRDVKADLFDWAQDYEAVISAAKAALPMQPLYLLGHSLGAQLPGLLRKPGQVDGLLSVAAGSGYWRDNAPKLRRVVPYFWWVLVPLATRLCGYFPGRALKKVGDLPAWARNCRACSGSPRRSMACSAWRRAVATGATTRRSSGASFRISGGCWCRWLRGCAGTFRGARSRRWATCRPG